MKVQFKKAAKKGFSLVELLVVIAVIGIMAAIAIPMISNINQKAAESKNKRNAQNIVSTYGAAIAAGANFGLGTSGVTVTNIVDKLKGNGINGAPPFAGSTFKIDIETSEITAAEAYLEVVQGAPPLITYKGTNIGTVTP